MLLVFFFSFSFSFFQHFHCSSEVVSYDTSLILKLKPDGKIAFSEYSKSDKPSIVCQSINTLTNAFRSTKLTLKNSYAGYLRKFPSKNCEGKFFVHSFQTCEVTPKVTSSWSEKNLPLFVCDNGLKVFYY